MRKILIVDGDYEFSRMVISFLENLKFEVAGANNLEEARIELDRFAPDLVLLSRELIGESGNLIPDGLGLLKEMKTHSRWKKIPVIFLVSSANEEDLDKLRRLKPKADDYASKPLEDSDLLRRIENLIGFDPEETNLALEKEKIKLSQKGDQAGTETGKDLERVAEKELKELLSRLGEALEQDSGIDFTPNVEELSKEQLRNELEFIQFQVREKEKQFQRLQEKWQQAIKILQEKIVQLEQEKRDLEEHLSELNAKFEKLVRENQELVSVLHQVRDLIRGMVKFKENWNRALDSLEDFLARLERIGQK